MFVEVLSQLLCWLPDQFDFGAEALRLVVLRLRAGLVWSDELAVMLRGCALFREREEEQEEDEEKLLLEPPLEAWTLRLCPLLFFADLAEQQQQQQPSTMSEIERLRATVGKLVLKVQNEIDFEVLCGFLTVGLLDIGTRCSSQGHVGAAGGSICP